METEVALYDRGMQTLVASWAEYARGPSSAAVLRFSGVAVTVFPAPPEREFYNHALVDRGRRTASLQSTAMAENVYAAVGFEELGRIIESAPTGDDVAAAVHSCCGPATFAHHLT